MNLLDKITITPGVCGGEPCIRSTRLTVRLILEMYDDGADDEYLLQNYPHLSLDDLKAARLYAAEYGILTNTEKRAMLYGDFSKRDVDFLLNDVRLDTRYGPRMLSTLLKPLIKHDLDYRIDASDDAKMQIRSIYITTERSARYYLHYLNRRTHNLDDDRKDVALYELDILQERWDLREVGAALTPTRLERLRARGYPV